MWCLIIDIVLFYTFMGFEVSLYVVGDVHGCLDQLQMLMEKINYSSSDQIVFLGDYVGRGPNSLGVLQYLRKLENAVCILGNHDLHLLYDYYVRSEKSRVNSDFLPIFSHPDVSEIMQWVRCLPLTHMARGAFFVHAGLYPGWTAIEAQHLGEEASSLLKGLKFEQYLSQMYGNLPNRWDSQLAGVERFRFVLNVFTRMRYLNADGLLDFSESQAPINVKDKVPWYEKITNAPVIYFGHWASLEGQVHTDFLHSMDGGCVWGGSLMAMDIESGKRFEVKNA